MAATILEDERLDEETMSSLDELQPAEELPQEPVEDPVEEIPEKYQGKTAAEIINMHKEAERLIGKQSSEVGELRQVVDSFIKSQLETPETQKTAEEIDFFENPKEAVNQSIENHPKIKEAERVTSEYKKQTSLAEMQRRHPDMYDIVPSEPFVEWIKASPIRTRLLAQADQQFDVEAGDELLTLWKERKQTASRTAELEKESRKQAVKEAATGNVRGSGESSRKIYRRADIIKLMKEDPDRYQSLSDEIMKAYAEGRVK